jgi:hypothetical protein
MKEIMKSLGKYVRKKKLEVKVEKTKIMVFNKRKSEENEWNWEGRKIERLKEFKYLGDTFNERFTDKDKDIREIVRKVMIFESMIESELIDVRSRDLGMEGTRGGKESARKIFEMGAGSGQINARLHSERRVQEE